MKSSCSARGLSRSQNLPEIALILFVSFSPLSDTLFFRLTLFFLIHPSAPPLSLSLYFTLLISLQLSYSPMSAPSMSFFSSHAVCHQYESNALICDRRCCQHLFSPKCLNFLLAIVSSNVQHRYSLAHALTPLNCAKILFSDFILTQADLHPRESLLKQPI